MSWVVDTYILIDILDADPEFGEASADLVEAHRREGLVICPVTYVELAPAFGGDRTIQDHFLRALGVAFTDWTEDDTRRAHQGWARHVRSRRTGQASKRPIADVFIGAFATRFDGLLTRNSSDFRGTYPDLPLRSSAETS